MQAADGAVALARLYTAMWNNSEGSVTYLQEAVACGWSCDPVELFIHAFEQNLNNFVHRA